MVGSDFGHYRIVRQLGAGGMGDVYLTDDTQLKRQVAIKILPTSLAAHPDRRDRFEREAQVVAALNHPNIVTIYSVEHDTDTLFLTMEYVEGVTLADLARRRALPPTRLLPIARQIVDAVVAAHDRGIIHRDLKPSNVMVGSHDRVKVLDFGLAKLRESTEMPVLASVPTRELTGEGMIVGTVAYMSPEQAEGKIVDERSDIFSIGVMLYELAAGDRPFKGDTSLSTLASILRETPKPLTEVNPNLPSDLARVVRHCLAKDPDRRYQSAKDLRNDLEDIDVTAILAAVALFAAWRYRASDRTPESPPSGVYSQLTQSETIKRSPSLSPDGKWAVYAASGDIFLQSITGRTSINLTKDSPVPESTPAFSPDGEEIVFRSERDGGGLFVMGRTGESVRRLTRGGFNPAWFPDGRQIVYSAGDPSLGPENRLAFSEMWVVPTAGGDPRRLFSGDTIQPRVSPHAKRIAYWTMPSDPVAKRLLTPNAPANRDVWTVDVNGQHPMRVTTHEANDWDPVWSPDGRWLYFLSNRSGSMNLWRVSIDEASGVVSGEPQPMTVPAPYVADFTLSSDGTIGAYVSMLLTANVNRAPFDPATEKLTGPIEPVTSGANDFAYFDVTADGSMVVAATSSRAREDLYVVPAAGGPLRELTHDFYRDRGPRWSADGHRILFYSDRHGYNLWSIDTDGASLRELLPSERQGMQYPVPSRDGSRLATADQDKRLMFVCDPASLAVLDTLPPFPDDSVVFPRITDWSSDGHALAIFGTSVPLGSVWVFSLDTRQYRRVANGNGPSWFQDGKRLMFGRGGPAVGNAQLNVADVSTGAMRTVLSIPGENVAQPRLAAHDTQLFFLHGRTSSDVWLVHFSGRKPDRSE